ncbi:hypothetical protein [Companilactobacillus zhachilii]|uniref:hypothetical protein n=1 Tax=Companilactobacillus zhachilii TaxID=2304606 RepID=UPI0040334B15
MKLDVAKLSSVDYESVNKYSNQDFLKVFNERNTLAAQVEKLQGIINDIAQKNPEVIPDYLMMEVNNNGTDNK